MDEFKRYAWERERICKAMTSPRMTSYEPPRWTVGNILGGLLMVGIGGFLIWGTVDDLAEHFKPAQPVAVKQETAPDVTTQIRNLERMIAEAKQLNADLLALHEQLTQVK